LRILGHDCFQLGSDLLRSTPDGPICSHLDPTGPSMPQKSAARYVEIQCLFMRSGRKCHGGQSQDGLHTSN
jgi:hypothetical protein